MADYLGFQYTTVSRAVTLFVVSLLPSSVDDSVQFYDTEFEGVPVRVYLPLNKLDNSRAVIYFHGGGFRLGDIGLLQFYFLFVCICGVYKERILEKFVLFSQNKWTYRPGLIIVYYLALFILHN